MSKCQGRVALFYCLKNMKQNELQLQIDKVYLNRKGEQRVITAMHSGAVFPFVDDMLTTYLPSGKYALDNVEDDRDLIMEFGTIPTPETPFEKWVKEAVRLGRESYSSTGEVAFLAHLRKAKDKNWT